MSPRIFNRETGRQGGSLVSPKHKQKLPVSLSPCCLALSLLFLAGCSNAKDPEIRDVRPLQIQKGERVTVEGGAGVQFVVGAPTRVVLDDIEGKRLELTARAIGKDRVMFDADSALAESLGGKHVIARTTVTVEQIVNGSPVVRHSSPAAKFELDLFPGSLEKLATTLSDKAPAVPAWLIWALAMLAACLIVALPVPIIGGLVVVWERKISAWMQVRIGPNRVGPNGWLQWLADGIKLIIKEDLVPTEADQTLFKAAPFLAFIGLFLVFMVLPFTQWLIVADLNIGLLFILSVTSLIVVSMIMGGWSSNSKWSLLGGMRSAAQIISYELPASVSLLSIAVLTGSLSTEAIVRAQGGSPWNWYLFRSPFLFVAFFIHFISSLAEGNRTPFDLPEAESELVSGYNTEYSGFRYALYPLVEWANVFVIGAISSLLFCGGWRIPGVSVATQDASGWLQLAGFSIYLAKIIFFIFVTIWIRWTLPRFRVDQMMNLCWKYFIPIAFACFVGTLAWAWLLPPVVQKWSPVLWFILCGGIPGFVFTKRVRFNRSRFKELNLNPTL